MHRLKSYLSRDGRPSCADSVVGSIHVLSSTALAGLLLAMLTGCVPMQDSLSASESEPSASATAEPTSSNSTRDSTAGRTAPSTPGCGPVQLYEPWSSEKPSLSSLGGQRLRIPSDQGPRAHASGTAETDEAGRAVAYVVAPDDVWTIVAERFCLHVDYVNALNHIRRNSAAELYVGDVLNLSPYTVTSVGSENGDVYDNAPPSSMPPQK